MSVVESVLWSGLLSAVSVDELFWFVLVSASWEWSEVWGVWSCLATTAAASFSCSFFSLLSFCVRWSDANWESVVFLWSLGVLALVVVVVAVVVLVLVVVVEDPPLVIFTLMPALEAPNTGAGPGPLRLVVEVTVNLGFNFMFLTALAVAEMVVVLLMVPGLVLVAGVMSTLLLSNAWGGGAM